MAAYEKSAANMGVAVNLNTRSLFIKDGMQWVFDGGFLNVYRRTGSIRSGYQIVYSVRQSQVVSVVWCSFEDYQSLYANTSQEVQTN